MPSHSFTFYPYCRIGALLGTQPNSTALLAIILAVQIQIFLANVLL